MVLLMSYDDESGTDEAEGSNDTYCVSEMIYTKIKLFLHLYLFGFSMTAITELQTSTAGTNPDQNVATFGAFGYFWYDIS